MKSVQELVREAESNYLEGSVSISEYVTFDMHDTIEKIEAYLNSKHISGSEDSLGREKPFFNIVTAASNIWYRATDIDRKDIRFIPTSVKQIGTTFVANAILQNWMKEARFGQFLNEWGRTLARYGSAVCKFVEQDGKLVAQVIPWNRLIVDPIDFYAIPTIEKIYLTPEQLKQNPYYDQDTVEQLINAKSNRKTLDGKNKDNQSNFIEVYEVHGEMPAPLLMDNPDEADEKQWNNYRQQMHVVSFVAGKDGGFSDYTLFKGKEKKHPYMITHLIPYDGRTLSIGAVEHLFEAQWMVNHSHKNIKDNLDLASKLIFQTSDASYVSRNVLSAIETGDILVHKVNEPLTQINNSKADITAFQNLSATWQSLAQDITSTPDAIRGNTLPSGTPYSLAAYSGGQANSLFELMTENKGLYLEDMLREYVIPHIKSKMDTKEEIVAVLDAQGVSEIDAMYVPNEAARRYNQEFKDSLIKGELPPEYDQTQAEGQVRAELAPLGNKRFFTPDDVSQKTWNDALKDFQWTVDIDITNESVDKQAVLQTLSALLQTIASNPTVLQDPNAKMVFGKILSETSVLSPLQISSNINAPTPTASPPGGTEALSELTNTQ